MKKLSKTTKVIISVMIIAIIAVIVIFAVTCIKKKKNEDIAPEDITANFEQQENPEDMEQIELSE